MPRFVSPEDAVAPAASVIIPSYQSEAVIGPCLWSIAAQDFDEPVEIIVVDSGTDGARDLIRREFPAVRLRTCEVQTWPGEGRNLGLELARGDLVICLDADTVPQPGWLAAMVARLRRGDAHLVTGAVRTLHPQSLVAHAAQICEFSGFTVWDRAREVPVCPGLTVGVRRVDLDRYGWRFPRLRCCEDIMFCHRVRADGGRVAFEPAAVVAHNDPTDIRHLIGKMELIGRTAGPLRRDADLPGRRFARHPCLIRLMPLVRTIIALARTFRWGLRPWWRSMRAAPLVYRAMGGYARGFRAGLRDAAPAS